MQATIHVTLKMALHFGSTQGEEMGYMWCA